MSDLKINITLRLVFLINFDNSQCAQFEDSSTKVDLGIY